MKAKNDGLDDVAAAIQKHQDMLDLCRAKCEPIIHIGITCGTKHNSKGVMCIVASPEDLHSMFHDFAMEEPKLAQYILLGLGDGFSELFGSDEDVNFDEDDEKEPVQ